MLRLSWLLEATRQGSATAASKRLDPDLPTLEFLVQADKRWHPHHVELCHLLNQSTPTNSRQTNQPPLDLTSFLESFLSVKHGKYEAFPENQHRSDLDQAG